MYICIYIYTCTCTGRMASYRSTKGGYIVTILGSSLQMVTVEVEKFWQCNNFGK